MSQPIFDIFDKFVGTPIWDVSSPDMMRKYSWTRLAWWNQRKVAVYLAAIDIHEQHDAPYLGVLVLTPEACVWAHSAGFSELLSYFTKIIRACGVDNDFEDYATYAMASFIDESFEEHGETAGNLIDSLAVDDPAGDREHGDDDLVTYEQIRHHLKLPLLDDVFVRYSLMRSNYYCYDSAVLTMEHLSHKSLTDKAGLLLKDTPALDTILNDYRVNFLNEKASEKPAKKPKRTTNVRELLWNSYPHVCGLCGEQINSIEEMHVDHIIPLSRGGKDILANLQLTHARCNTDKGNTLFEESEE